MTLYFALVSTGIVAFWIYYLVTIKRSTHFQANRWYLLFGLILSFIAPLSFDFVPSPHTDSNSFAGYMIQSSLSVSEPIGQQINDVSLTTEKAHGSWLATIYFIGVGILLLRLFYGLFQARSLFVSEIRMIENRPVYQHKNIYEPFSLFRSIHIPASWNWNMPKEVLFHEVQHIKQLHFIDLLLIEIACIVLWFNPIIHLYKKSIRLNLEYLADKGVLDQGLNPVNYQKVLLTLSLQNKDYIPLKMNFTTPLKNRIQMMNKRKSNSIKKLAILGLIPLTALLMALNSSDKLKEPIKSAITPISALTGQENDRPEGMPIKRNQLGRLSSLFGKRIHPVEKTEVFHEGIDMVADMGTPVYATASGTVGIAKYDEQHGYFVKLNHSTVYQTQYSHLKNFVVMQGALVQKGQLIGYVGNSGISMGPHLHYEVHKNGEAVNPKDYLNLDDC